MDTAAARNIIRVRGYSDRLLGSRSVYVSRTLTRDELAALIVEPADAAGYNIETSLVDTIINDSITASSAADRRDGFGRSSVLPLLEFALSRLWAEKEDGVLTYQAYANKVGRVSGALAGWANKVYEGLTEEKKQWAKRILLDLVYLGDQKQQIEPSRRRRTVAEIHGWAAETTDSKTEKQRQDELAIIRDVIDTFAGSDEGESQLVVTDRNERGEPTEESKKGKLRLLVTDQNERGEPTVELIHDELFRAWGKYRDWLSLEKDRPSDEFLLWRQRVEAKVREWIASSPNPRKRNSAKLLTGSDLAEAELHLTKREPDFKPNEREYVRAGIRRRVFLYWVSRIGGVAALALAVIVSIVMSVLWNNASQLASRNKKLADDNGKLADDNGKRAEENRLLAEKNRRALARSIVRPLGLRPDVVADAEIGALQELANGDDTLRLLVIDLALQDPVTTRQLRNRADLTLHAVMRLNPAIRKRIEQMLLTRLRNSKSGVTYRLDCALIGVALCDWSQEFAYEATQVVTQGILTNSNPDEFDGFIQDGLIQGVERLSRGLNPQGAAALAKKTLESIGDTTRPGTLNALVRVVAALAPRLEPPKTQALVGETLSAMAKTRVDRVPTLGLVVTKLAPRLEPGNAKVLCGQALQLMHDSRSSTELALFAGAVKDLAPRLEPQEATVQLKKAVRLTLDRLRDKTTDSKAPAVLYELSALASALVVLSPWMEPSDAGEACQQAMVAMPKCAQDGSADLTLSWLAGTVGYLAPRSDQKESREQAGEALQLVLKAISKSPQFNTSSSLARAAVALARALGSKEALTITKQALVAVKTPGSTGPSWWTVKDLAPRLQASDAALASAQALDQMVATAAAPLNKDSRTNTLDARNVYGGGVGAAVRTRRCCGGYKKSIPDHGQEGFCFVAHRRWS